MGVLLTTPPDGTEERRCSRCGVSQPKDAAHFPILYVNQLGVPVLESYCRPCRRAHKHAWQLRKRARLAAANKAVA